MSESRLGVSITATDTSAAATIKQLETTLRGLQQTLAAVGSEATRRGGELSSTALQVTNTLKGEIEAINTQIAALRNQSTAIKTVTAAMQEQATAGVTFKSTLQGINEAFGLNDRAMKSASDSARTLSTSLNAAADADGMLRDKEIQLAESTNISTAAIERQNTALRTLSGAQFFGQMERRMGIGQQPLSAESSASAFQKSTAFQNIGAGIGSAVSTVSSAGFSKMTADLAGVKQSYLSAAESAAVFQRAGLTATEASLGMTEKSVAQAAAAEAAMARTGRAVNVLGTEARHLVAAFDELARGQRGALFSTMGAAARDAGAGIGLMSASIAGLVVVMGSEAIIHGAERMGKWATETRAAASAAGMGIEQYSQLQGAFTLIGLKGSEADAALRRLADSLSKGLADPASLAAEAFHNLGIRQDELVATGGNVAALLPRLADAFVQTADGANKTANMAEIAGRGFERLIPALNKGGEGFRALQAEAKALGITLNEQTAASLEKTGQEADKLSAIIKGQGIQAFVAWGETIQGFMKILEALGAGIGYISKAIADLGKNATTVFSAINAGMGVVAKQSGASARGGQRRTSGDDASGEFPSVPQTGVGYRTGTTQLGPPAPVAPLTAPISPLEKMRHDMAQAAEVATRGAGTAKAAREAADNAEIASMQKVLQTGQLTAKQREDVETELANKQRTLRTTELSGGGGAAAAHQATRDFIAEGKLQIAEAQGNSQKIAAIYDNMLAGLVSSHTATAAQIATIEREKVQAINKARLEEIKAGAKDEEQQSRLSGLNRQLGQISTGQMKFQGQKEGPGADLERSTSAIKEAELVRATAQEQITALMQVRDSAEAGSNIQKTAAAEILSVEIDSKSKEVALYKEAGAAAVAAANKSAEAFTTFFSSVGSQFEGFSSSIIKSLLSPQQDMLKVGLTTRTVSEQGNEIRTAFRNIFLSVASDFGKAMEQAVGHVIANVLSKGAADSIGQLLSQTLSKAVSSVVGSAAGSAVGNVAGSAAGGAGSSIAITGAITTAATAQTTAFAGDIAVQTATLSAATAASATSIVGAITAEGLATNIELFALNAKPSVLGTTYASGGIVPSAAGGMVVGGTGGSLAILHAKEMVLPAPISQGIQNMVARGTGGGGGGNSASLNFSPTINTGPKGRGGTGLTRAEFGQMMALQSGSMLGEARNMIRQGWRPS